MLDTTTKTTIGAPPVPPAQASSTTTTPKTMTNRPMGIPGVPTSNNTIANPPSIQAPAAPVPPKSSLSDAYMHPFGSTEPPKPFAMAPGQPMKTGYEAETQPKVGNSAIPTDWSNPANYLNYLKTANPEAYGRTTAMLDPRQHYQMGVDAYKEKMKMERRENDAKFARLFLHNLMGTKDPTDSM